MMPQRKQEKDSNSGVNLFEIWGVVDPGKKIRFLQANFRKISIFQAILQKNIKFCRQISENFDFFQAIKTIRFSKQKNFHLQPTSGQIILFFFKSNHFRTYFLYMKIYNNISRPVHDSNDPPATLPATPCPKSGGRD